MQIYALRMNNFFRFRESNNSIVFDPTDDHRNRIETKQATLDSIYDEVMANPVKHIEAVKNDNCLVNLTGISGIIGNNFDRSNGVGKSTVMEAICYGLYDHIVRKNVNTDKKASASISVVTRINGVIPDDIKECFVEILFEESGRIYRLKRIRKVSKNRKDHSPDIEFECLNVEEVDDRSEASHRTPDTNDAILEAVNMDYEVFVNSVMFGQNDAGKFLTGTDKIRKEMLVKLLHLEDVVNGCLETVRDRKNKKEKEIDKIRTQIEMVKQSLQGRQSQEEMEASIADLEKQISIATKKSSENTKKLGELENSDVLKRSGDLKVKVDKLISDIGSKKSQKAGQVAEWERLESETASKISNQEARVKKGQAKTVELSQSSSSVQKAIDGFDMNSFKGDLEKIAKAKDMKPKFTTRIEEVKKEREEKVISSTKVKVEVDRLEAEIKPLKAQLDEAKSGSFVCDKCRSEVSKDHIEGLLKDANESLDKAKSTLKDIDKEIEVLSDKISKGAGKLDQINTLLIKEGKIDTEIQAFENNKSRVQDLEKQSKEALELLKDIEDDIAKMKSQQLEYKAKVVSIGKQYDDEIKAMSAESEKISAEREKVNSDAAHMLNEINTLKEQNDKITKGKADRNSKIGSLNKDIENLIKDSKKVKTLEAEMEVEIKILNRLLVLEDVYGLEGIQTRVVKKYLPLLNVFVKDFLDVLSGGEMSVKLFVNNKSKVDMKIGGNSGDTFNMLSGGEKELARLSVAIGLALLSFSRSSCKPEIICLDEIFGSLDNNRIQSVFKLLDKLKDKFSRVLVISHDANINEKLDHHILIEKDAGDNGTSKIREIT